MEPRPHVTQDPMEGFPLTAFPVYMRRSAGAWLNWSVCMERTTHTSAA